MSEEILVAEARRGCESAFETLCRNSMQRIYRTVFRITKNREDAEDAVQDAFLRAFVHVKEFDARSSFSTWLTRIAINSALMILRKRRLGREVPMDVSSDGTETHAPREAADVAPDPEIRFALKQREEILKDAVGGLRPTNRRVIELHFSDDHSMKETARMTGISVCAAKSRLFHAKVKLRKTLKAKAIGETFIPQPSYQYFGRSTTCLNDGFVEMRE